MNLKQQIAKFRSEILIGKYESAIIMGKNILSQIDVLIHLKILKDERLQSIIQEEYQKCLSLNSLIHNKIRLREHQIVKKWGKQSETKWKKKQDPISSNQLQIKQSNDKNIDHSPIKNMNYEQYIEFEERINREVMMPIKMPSFFKQQTISTKIIAIPEEYYKNMLTYFLQNDFMSIQYQSFQYQLSKDVQQTYFWQNNISEILIDCPNMRIDQINISKYANTSHKFNCIFLTICGGGTFQMI